MVSLFNVSCVVVYFTARKRSLRRLRFYTCLSFCPHGGVCLSACCAGISYPPDQAPPWEQTTPQEQTPPNQAPPWTRHHPPGADHPRHPPWDQAPPTQCMLGDTVNKQVVCIPLECNLVTILLTSGNKIAFH